MRIVRKLVVPVVVVAALAGGYLYMRHRRAQAEEPPPPETATVERQDIVRVVTATGIVRPKNIVEVKPKKGGTVVAIPVAVDQDVRAGDVLAVLDTSGVDPTVYQAQASLTQARAQAQQAALEADYQRISTVQDVAASQAALAKAGADVAVAEAQLEQDETTTEKDVDSARARLSAAEARLEQARQEAAAQEKLTASSLDQAKARVAAQEQALALLQAGPRKQEIESQRAAVAEARVAERNAKKELERQQSLAEKGFVSRQAVETAETAHEQAKAGRVSADKALEMAEEGSRPEEIAQGQAQLKEARAALAAAEADRVQIALKQEAVRSADADVSDARAALASAEARRAQVRVRGQQLKAAETGAVQAQANLAKARAAELQDRAKGAAAAASTAAAARAAAQLADAQYRLEMEAPISGVVISQPWEIGMLLPAGFSAVSSGVSITQSVPPIVIADTSEMLVYADVDESDIAGVREGMTAEVVVDALPEHPFTGDVYRIIPQGVEEQSVVSFQVRVLLKGDVAMLKAGMTADINVETARAKNAVAVPNEAVNSGPEGKYVLMAPAEEGAEPEERPVTTGLTDFVVTEIKSGLKAGEEVLVSGGFGGPGDENGRPDARRRMMMQMRRRTQGR